ncbi:MAG: hypothetical protein JWR72_1865 [Flavisolibacter sp.]|jgi:hypothetical protein|nr:hypothetical protein [Flavisolibacter sp.]
MGCHQAGTKEQCYRISCGEKMIEALKQRLTVKLPNNLAVIILNKTK